MGVFGKYGREHGPVITPENVRLLKRYGTKLPDDTPLNVLLKQGTSSNEEALEGWIIAFSLLSSLQKAELKKAIRGPVRAGFVTLEELRKATDKEVAGASRGISERGSRLGLLRYVLGKKN